MRIALLLALLLACGVAQAAEWVSVDKQVGGIETFVDVSSIRIAGSIRRFWTKGVPPPRSERGPVGYTDKWLDYFLAREAINCDDETYRVESKVAYWDDGSTLEAPGGTTAAWKPVPPESRAEVEMKLVCALKSK